MNIPLAIIGSGPAALTAAIYSSRAGLNPVVFEGELDVAGGQLMTTTDVENFPGFPDGIDGFELVENMKKQAQKFGTQFIGEYVNKVDFSNGFLLFTNTQTIMAKCVIIATGAVAKKLTFTGSDMYWNKGISACAVCDGASSLFKNKPLAVIGGGDSAMEEALFLTKFGSVVYILVRGDTLRASKYMKAKAEENPKIKFLYLTQVLEAKGDTTKLKSLVINTNGEIQEIECNGLFYAIGHIPATEILKGQLALDDQGYIKTIDTITNIPGILACGDVQDHQWRQAITASASGCIAALQAEKFLSK